MDESSIISKPSIDRDRGYTQLTKKHIYIYLIRKRLILKDSVGRFHAERNGSVATVLLAQSGRLLKLSPFSSFHHDCTIYYVLIQLLL